MLLRTLTIAAVLASTSFMAEAKKLKPKYYQACYADYTEMRELVPKPPLDIAGSAKTAGKVAGLAGRLGGFGGGFGSLASTASTVAKYSETIADVAAFTQTMSASFPNSSDRYLAYGERMETESVDMERVAEFAIASQECYAGAFSDLQVSSNAGKMKAKQVKKRHKEIKLGVTNVGEMLAHATQYMDTNINAYNEAMTIETTGAGLNLTNLLSMASEAQSVMGQVQSLTPATGSDFESRISNRYYMTQDERLTMHRQVVLDHYQRAGVAPPAEVAGPVEGIGGLFGGMGSLTSLAQLGSMSPAVAAQVAISQAQSSAAIVGLDQTASVSAPSADERVVALAKAGEDIQPYLASYQRVKALAMMHQGIEGMVNQL